ncbi:MAG TPA: 50S ribosomal protein L3 [Spirochaetota bacterium]|nr:50S ribosomal protein L3 [Spirochaetota bacterium]HOM37914.1 50S ribosomal protein L3 [Spirochaetota bacterium]HPQ48718.1 50S ribosomal protein L3 [Spirochaetota bacterium]
MSLGFIGQKLGMLRLPNENGEFEAVTVIYLPPMQVLEIKTEEKDGYSAIKVGAFETLKRVNKPTKGYFEALSKLANKTITPKKYLKEFRLKEGESVNFNVGDVLNVDLFKNGEIVDITGITKGKGFQGVVKRHGFSGGPASHGSQFHRRPGSIGAHTFPARVWKEHRMPGHMGFEKVTVKNIKIVKVDTDKSLILVKGAVPGPNRGVLYIKKK